MLKAQQLYIFFITSILLLLLDSAGLLKVPTSFISQILVSPLKMTVYTGMAVIKDSSEIILHYSQIAGIASDAQKQNKINMELSVKIKELALENARLREQLGAPIPATYKIIPAKVISVSKFMEISVGSMDQIKTGMVVVDGTTLIGKVSKTEGFRSGVLLPYDPQSNIPVRTSRGTRGEVIGQAGGVILMDKILQKDSVFLDDLVVTSGEGEYPPNLIIGKIIHVNTDDVSPYKQAKIMPAVNYNTETYVYVLTSI